MKVSLFADNVILYIKALKTPLGDFYIWLRLKVSGHKINRQKPVSFLQIYHRHAEENQGNIIFYNRLK